MEVVPSFIQTPSPFSSLASILPLLSSIRVIGGTHTWGFQQNFDSRNGSETILLFSEIKSPFSEILWFKK
jgi:hypothetical protein